MGTYIATIRIFNGKTHGTQTCALGSLRHQQRRESICILSDSQAALNDLALYRIALKLAWECPKFLVRHNKVNLVRVPGHRSIAGNQIADQLAKEGYQINFTRRCQI